jgi:predicted ribosome quality control (RQC) complex YloA/Tae2 family protein
MAWRPYSSVTEAIAQGFLPAFARAALEARRCALVKGIDAALARERARLEAAEKGLGQASEWPTLEKIGNLLKSQMGAVRPFAKVATVTDYYDPAAPAIEVGLKPDLAPRQNVERYFQRAKKHKASIWTIERRIREHRENLGLLEGIKSEAAQVRGREQLDALETRVRALTRAVGGAVGTRSRAGASRGKRPARGSEGVLTFVSSDGRRILVGRSAAENEYLTRKLAKPHDLWLHVEGAAGAHVVVRTRGPDDDGPRRTIEEAAMLAAHYSKARYDTRVRVIVARARQVRKAPGAPVGEVTVRDHTAIVVKPDPAIAGKLAAPL